MFHYIQLLRPLQWLKNMFVFAPIFFSNNLLKPDYFWPTLVVFASFCLISSSIYCFNDLRMSRQIVNIPRNAIARLHPERSQSEAVT